MVKGNLGTGILAMAKTFSHAGLVNAILGLPLICLISTYCVHLLVNSAAHLERKLLLIKHSSATTTKSGDTPVAAIVDESRLEYTQLAKISFKLGPKRLRSLSSFMQRAVDGSLIVSQVGVCCVYLVFVVDNLTEVGIVAIQIVIGLCLLLQNQIEHKAVPTK